MSFKAYFTKYVEVQMCIQMIETFIVIFFSFFFFFGNSQLNLLRTVRDLVRGFSFSGTVRNSCFERVTNVFTLLNCKKASTCKFDMRNAVTPNVGDDI